MTRDVTPVKMSEVGLLFGCVQVIAALLTGSDALHGLLARCMSQTALQNLIFQQCSLFVTMVLFC